MKTARIGTFRDYEEVELIELQWSVERQCVVCPECGEELTFEEACWYRSSDGDAFSEPQEYVTCYRYYCESCARFFYSQVEI